MSSGKSTLGYQLAKALSMPFFDIDRQVAAKEQQSVANIFEIHGQEYFRIKEQEALHSTFNFPHLVIATGGGTPCFYDNMDQMKNAGLTFYLKLPLKTLSDRLVQAKKKRPLVSGMPPDELENTVRKLFEVREPYYKQAHYTVDVDNKSAVYYMSRILSGHMY